MGRHQDDGEDDAELGDALAEVLIGAFQRNERQQDDEAEDDEQSDDRSLLKLLQGPAEPDHQLSLDGPR